MATTTDISAIREGLADAMATPGWRVYAYMPENPELPCIVVPYPDDVTYAQHFKQGCELTFSVLIAALTNDYAYAQTQIDDMLSFPTGIAAQVMSYSPATPVWKSALTDYATNIRREITTDGRVYLIAELHIVIKT